MYTIFLTGTTGFLGTEIISELMQTTDDVVYGLTRAGSVSEAINTLTALWYGRPELTENLGSRILPVPGDITKENLGLSDTDQERLIHHTDFVIHTAAVIGINHSRKQFWEVNVTGTNHVLEFARRIQADHPLRRFSHVSTAYVAGTRIGQIMEDSLTDAGFSSLYEQSKFEGERLVTQAMGQLPVSVFRPGQIVGDSRTGFVKNFNTLYYPLKLYLKQQMRVFPIKKSMRVNMVPVDYVAKSIVRITYAKNAAGKTFHLTAPTSAQPTVAELIDAVRDWAEKNLSMRLPKPLFFPVPFLGKIGASRNLSEEKPAKKSVLTNMLSLAPYFTENKTYDTTNTERFMGAYQPDWRKYLPNLLAYATDRNFLDHNSRTVFEQVRFCLNRKNTSITYYDVTGEGIRENSASSVNERIEETLKALQALGIGSGSKVAVSGINSVTYFVLDVAIGLSGATSVPLYYTTPANELDELLQKSGANWFFIGDIRILSHVNEMTFGGTMVSFTENAPLAEDGEILVEGPQVAMAYDGREDTRLHTGDLGAIAANGHLQIIGRKKEILINSYGKNINLQKVETLLRDIPGISEALLVGEQRPYCIVLLWPEDEKSAPDEATLMAEVRAVNEQLSHPEQVKRYALMSSPLKISTGELTPNLKLRRKNIMELHQGTIDGLYMHTATPVGDVLLIGAL